MRFPTTSAQHAVCCRAVRDARTRVDAQAECSVAIALCLGKASSIVQSVSDIGPQRRTIDHGIRSQISSPRTRATLAIVARRGPVNPSSQFPTQARLIPRDLASSAWVYPLASRAPRIRSATVMYSNIRAPQKMSTQTLTRNMAGHILCPWTTFIWPKFRD